MDGVYSAMNSSFMLNIGQRLRERGRELGLSDAEVARRAGISEPRYGHYVRGMRSPDYVTLLRLCDVLNTSPNILLGYEAAQEADQKREKLLARIRASANALTEDDLEIAAAQIDAFIAHRKRP